MLEDKKCPHCGEAKLISAFYNDRSQNTGKSVWCRQCHSNDNKKYKYNRKEYYQTYRKKNRKSISRKNRERRKAIKIEVLTYYGNGKICCVICGEEREACLSIDHINEDGANHRRQLKSGYAAHFHEWLKHENFPEGYQTLCMNCQWVKHRNWQEAEEEI